MAFARSVADHEHTHGEKTRETPADGLHRSAQRRNSFDKILLHKKERLNRPNLARLIFQQQITVLEFRIERLLHDLVEPVVFALPRESALFQASQCSSSARESTRATPSGNGMVWPVGIGAEAEERPTLNPPPQGSGGQVVASLCEAREGGIGYSFSPAFSVLRTPLRM